jgi:UDP-GlcNAc:undecaprenyl-phosphate/decaprenyl-phosphate GlcNAc-1-phosphate transferase
MAIDDYSIGSTTALILALTCAMFVTWYLIPRVIKIVNERRLTDKPGKHKIHKLEVPTLGGIGIFGGFAFGFMLAVNSYMYGVSYFTAALLGLFFIGLNDDLVHLNPIKKLLGEIGAALIIVLFSDLHFTSLHGLFGITSIPLWASYSITVFLMVLIINAFNLIDGIDGLAASVGIIASLAFGSWFWLSDDYGYAIMAAALLGSLIAFFRFNISTGLGKIFMGDTGSLVIGLVLAVFAIRFNELTASEKSFISLQSAPSVSIAILIVPLFDTLRIIILRLFSRQNLFEADNRHIHHLMLQCGFSHLRSTLIISVFNLFLIAVAFALDKIGILTLGVVLLSLCIIATEVLKYRIRNRE